MEELIKKWEKRVKHYRKLAKAETNSYRIERLFSAIITLNICIDELEHAQTNYQIPVDQKRFEGAKCAFCGKRARFNHKTEERICCNGKYN